MYDVYSIGVGESVCVTGTVMILYDSPEQEIVSEQEIVFVVYAVASSWAVVVPTLCELPERMSGLAQGTVAVCTTSDVARIVVTVKELPEQTAGLVQDIVTVKKEALVSGAVIGTAVTVRELPEHSAGFEHEMVTVVYA